MWWYLDPLNAYTIYVLHMEIGMVKIMFSQINCDETLKQSLKRKSIIRTSVHGYIENSIRIEYWWLWIWNLNGFHICEYLNVIVTGSHATHHCTLIVVCVWWHNSVNSPWRDDLNGNGICICYNNQIDSANSESTGDKWKKNSANYYELTVRNLLIEILCILRQLLLMRILPEN